MKLSKLPAALCSDPQAIQNVKFPGLQEVSAKYTFKRVLYSSLAKCVLVLSLLGLEQVVFAATESELAVQRAYLAYYARPGDPAGVAFWSSRLETIGDISDLIDDFGTSEEYVERFGNLDAQTLVNNIYLNLFNRGADQAGLNFYSGLLSSGQSTLAQISLDILNGAQNADLTIIENKLEVADYYTTAVAEGSIDYDLEQAADLVEDVDATTASVTQAQSVVGLVETASADNTTDSATSTPAVANTFASRSALGEQLFSEQRLSFNGTQSCATCHNPGKGFIDDRDNNVLGAVSLGDDGISLGNRNSPTVAYAALIPDFQGDDEDARGGQFMDGRSEDLREQAGEPFLNPLEMGMPNRASVVARIESIPEYAAAFRAFYGEAVFNDTDTAYDALSDSIASFQETDAVSPFDSKYDRALAGTYSMTQREEQGMNLFFSNQASCLECHHLDNTPNRSPTELFTSHRYFNIGTPANERLNNYLRSVGQQTDLVNNGDQGLFENPLVGNDQQTRGLFKVPTLRNIAVTAPYMHNGVFNNLETVIHFYDHQGGRGRGNGNNNNNNRRPINPETGQPWGNPEVNANISNNRLRMGGLNNNEVDALECFLRVLTDRQFEADLPPLRAGLTC